MSKKQISTWRIEDALTRHTKRTPESQAIARGILAIATLETLSGGISQLKSALESEKYPLTEELLCQILIAESGLEPKEAKRRARLVFN